MTLQGVINRLERLSFEATQSWDGSYTLRMNRHISGMSESLAIRLTTEINATIKKIHDDLKKEVDKYEQLELSGLGTPPVDNPVVGSDSWNNHFNHNYMPLT
jgi:hypothetical protein